MSDSVALPWRQRLYLSRLADGVGYGIFAGLAKCSRTRNARYGSGGCLLFDGCLLDNLPMDVMRERLGSATVIAVDVVPPHDLKVQIPDMQSPSGWWLLWRKLNPFTEKVAMPNIVAILHRAGELGSVYGRQKLIDQRIADRYIQPPVDHINIADFGGIAEARQIGYNFCKRKLKTWWDLHQAAQNARPRS